MLLYGSISLKVTVLLLVHQTCAQEEYGVDSGELSEYNSEDGDSHGHPDYSKYFSVDGPPASGALTGFAGGSEFAGFFSPQPVGYATNTKQHLTAPAINFVPQHQQSQVVPLFAPIKPASEYHPNGPLKDFFEESQRNQELRKRQPLSDEYIKPGPSYVSHQLPLSAAASANIDDVERIPPKTNKQKPKKESDDETDYTYKDQEEEVDKNIAANQAKHAELSNSKPFVDYDTGKASSIVSAYPTAAGLLDSHSSKLIPYQKYSFQPLAQASRIRDNEYYNIKPFNPNYEKKLEPYGRIESQPSENVPSHLKNHDCRQLSDSGSEGMNCFVCVNAETKSKYTQCSYTSDKKPVAYNKGYSERYSKPAEEGHFRYRRYAGKKVDPYYTISERSRKSFDEPTIPEDYSAGFKYDEEEAYDGSHPEVSYSEQQSEQIKKNPENCKKVEKEGSTCTVCHDPKNGGNFEQCSYTSEPAEKKYAYVKEKKYSSDDEPEESKTETKTENPPKLLNKKKQRDVEHLEKHNEQIDQTKTPKKRNDDADVLSYENYEKNRDKSRARFVKNKYEVPKHFSDSIVKESRAEASEDDDSSKDFDAYHSELFPEFSKEESRKKENREEQEQEEEEYQIPESTKQNVEEVLAEFSKKDRSNCKKSEKNGMTCFLCVDKKQIQHEECMFIQESKPKSSHVAYHQLKGIKNLENDEEQTDESKNKPILTSAQKTEFHQKQPLTDAIEAAASEGHETRVAYQDKKDFYKKKRSPKKYKKEVDPEPTIKTPVEFDVGKEEGAYSAETKQVHSKLHGVLLPKYMVDKSEYEQEFDAFSGAL